MTNDEKPMITIRPIMNSAVEEIFAFKTCCGLKVFDQNLEIHMTNLGVAPVRIQGYFDLALSSGVHRVETLFPPGELPLAPGETRAFYCTMDEILWKDAESITFYDKNDRPHKHVFKADNQQPVTNYLNPP